MKKTIFLSALALTLAGCGQDTTPEPAAGQEATATAAPQKAAGRPELGDWGIDLTAMDRETEAGEDFGRYVNGTWLDTFEIPADRSRWGVFDILRERSTEQVNAIITELGESTPEAGSLEQKVGDFYATWMDLDTLNEKDAAPLEPHLAEIAAISDHTGIMKAMASLHGTGPFGVGIIPDPADTTRYTVIAGQAGLGMPDRDYYLRDEERFQEFRAKYRDFVAKVQELAGIEDAEAKADAIIALETRLAEVHWTPADSRNIQKIYNPMTRAELAALAPQFDWDVAMETVGLGDHDNVIVLQPSAFEGSGKIYAETPMETWKDYLAYHFVRNHAQYLSESFDDASFEFYSQTLRGIEEKRERWKRGADLVNRNLGEAVGQIYVDKHFPPESKEMMDQLVANLRDALEERIQLNGWMDEETRQAALVKLGTFEPRIGYTEKWTDYSTLDIENGDMLGNALRITEFQWRQRLDRLGGPVDRAIWPYPPQTVNASYNPLLNQITFPAGILQPPFFDPHADPAVNYGAIGAVIGHEIGHGFDDQGRRFDEKGLIRDWWTPAADAAFKERSSRLVEQYGKYSPLPGMFVNGELTLGENIGDLGGLEMAYSAYKRHVAKYGEPPVLDGYTGDQRFFLSWAQVWRSKKREDALREQILRGPHSPENLRINAVVRNVDAWYDAFQVAETDALYLPPEERVSIW